LRLDDETQHLDDVSHNRISRNRLDQRDAVFGLEVRQRVLDLADNSEVVRRVVKLRVDIDLVRNFSERFPNKEHMPFLDRLLQIDSFRMLHKQCDLRLVISRLEVNVRCGKVVLLAAFNRVLLIAVFVLQTELGWACNLQIL